MATKELSYYSAYTFGAGTWPSGDGMTYNSTFCLSSYDANNGDSRRYYVGLSNGRTRIQFTTPNDTEIAKITKVVFKFTPDEYCNPKYTRGFLSTQKTTSSDTDYITASQVISTSYVYTDENKSALRSAFSASTTSFGYLVFTGLNLAKNTTYYIYINMYASAYGESATSIGSNSNTGDIRARAYDNNTTNSYKSILTITYDKPSVKVTFNGNGATSNSFGTQTYTYGVSGQKFTGSISRTGYSMLGWSESSTATTATYGTNSGVSDSWILQKTTRTLYAVWKINTYTVSYNANGHGTAPAAQTKTYGTNLALRAFIANQGSAPSTNTYTITANANSGSLGTGANGSATYRAAYNTYSQTYWNTNASGTGTNYSSGGTYSTNAEATMYAIWKTNSNAAAYTYKLPTYSPTRTGYDWDGKWWTAASGGTQRTTSSNVTAAETVYPHWTAKSISVTLNQNGGYGGTTSVSIKYNTAVGNYPSITKPTRVGYTFNGYYTATSGGTQYYNSDGNSVRVWDIASATTLYAQWTANTYTITFNANGGTCGTSSKTFTYTGGVQIDQLPIPTRPGYKFIGWAYNLTGSNQTINFGRNYMYKNKISIHVDVYREDWSTSSVFRIFSCAENGGWNIEHISGKIDAAIYSEDLSSYALAASTQPWNTLSSGWHTFDVVFNGTNAKLYIDNTLAGTSEDFTTIGYHSTNSIFLGAEAGSSGTEPVSYDPGIYMNFSVRNSSARTLKGTTSYFTIPAQNATMYAQWEIQSMMHIYHNGEWKLVIPYIYE